MRAILDPVSPKMLRPVFTSVFRQLQRGKGLESMTFLDGHYLLALDGTEYFSSKTIHCASCLHRVHRNGSITYPYNATFFSPPFLGVYDARDRPGDCAVGPTPQKRGSLQSYLYAGATRLGRAGAAATP